MKIIYAPDCWKTNPIQSQSNPIQTQNKPNSLDAQMNVGSVITKDYENKPLCRCGENKPNYKPNQTQFQKGHPCCSQECARGSGYFSGGGYGIFSVLIRKAKTSACSSMTFDIGFPRPWPALVSTRSRIGFLPAALACRVATNFLA
jgi:hypothetical protein